MLRDSSEQPAPGRLGLGYARPLAYGALVQVHCAPASIYKGRASQPRVETQCSSPELTSSTWRLNQAAIPHCWKENARLTLEDWF